MSTVALLTRGDESWGTSHLRRAGWLRAALSVQDAVSAVSILSADSPLARRLLVGVDSDVRFFPADWISTVDSRLVSLASEAELVIVDWLDSPPELIAALRAAGCRTALLDDYGPALELADLAVNSLLAGLEPTAQQIGDAQLYSGLDYLQLPPGATKLRNVGGATARAMATELSAPPPKPTQIQAVMVSFSGLDQRRLIAQALGCLAGAGYRRQVLVMPAPETDQESQPPNVEFIAEGQEFHSLLAACDLAICGGGLRLYEAAYLGVPAIAVALPAAAPGHERYRLAAARKLESAGCCRAVGLAGEVTDDELTAAIRELIDQPQRRLEMAARGMRLLDGRGMMRTTELLLRLV